MDDDRLEIVVDGCRQVEAPATYAQCGVSWAMAWMAHEPSYFNIAFSTAVPPGTAPDRVVAALRRVVGELDTCRTTFELRDGELWQVVTGSGAVVVEVRECSGEPVEALVRDLERELASTPFRTESDWPVRLGLVTEGGSPRFIVLGCNHMALDLRGWRSLEEALQRVMADVDADLSDLTGAQPADESAFQRSAAGQAVNRAALDRWERILREAPVTLFDFDTAPDEPKRYAIVMMESRALGAALAMTAGRTRVSDSAVLLAAISLVFGRYSAHGEAVVQVNVANRLRPGTESIAGHFCWDSLFFVDLDAASFDEVCRRTFADALECYQHGVYDRASARARKEAVELERGAHIDLGCHLNDRREHTGLTAALVHATAPDLAGLRDETRVWIDSSHERVDTRFHVNAMDPEVGSITLEVVVDTRYLPLDHVEQVLRAIEDLVVAAAAADMSADEMVRSIELTPAARRSGWVRHGTGWVHVPSVEQLWSDLVGPHGAIFADPTGDGTHRLTAYLQETGGRRSIAEVHASFVEALGERSDVRAPDIYVRCAEVPLGAGDQSAWERCGVERGTGRREQVGGGHGSPPSDGSARSAASRIATR